MQGWPVARYYIELRDLEIIRMRVELKKFAKKMESVGLYTSRNCTKGEWKRDMILRKKDC